MKDTQRAPAGAGAREEEFAPRRGLQPETADDPVVEDSPGPAARGVKLLIGKVVLMVCPSGRKECKNVHCRLQPFCACARADFETARKSEARVWMAVALCGALVLLMSFIWAIMSRR